MPDEYVLWLEASGEVTPARPEANDTESETEEVEQ